MKKIAYLLSSIEDYGAFISFCIEHDICVFRTYWDEREKGERCYFIDWQEKRCYYSSVEYYLKLGYKILTPVFYFNSFGKVHIRCKADVYDYEEVDKK